MTSNERRLKICCFKLERKKEEILLLKEQKSKTIILYSIKLFNSTNGDLGTDTKEFEDRSKNH